MYKGKFSGGKVYNKRRLVLALALVLILTASIFSTIAYLTSQGAEVVNTFEPGHVPNKVVEKTDGGVKETVQIRNCGNVEAYVRTAVVITWADGSGNVLGVVPVLGEDYTITFAENTGWTKGFDDYYYYTAGPVAPDAATAVLISRAEQLKNAPVDGYYLSVEIMGQTVQAMGKVGQTPVVETLWPVTVNPDGSLTLK